MPEHRDVPRASAPFLRSREHIGSAMADVIFALLPALAFSVYFFGLKALLITLTAIAACIAGETLSQLLLRRPLTAWDGSPIVTGLLLAFCLPVTVPLWIPALGGLFAIVIVKQLYGGIGKNVFNPALAGVVFLQSFPALVTRWTAPMAYLGLWGSEEVVAAAATPPLISLRQGVIPENVAVYQLFLGQTAGNIGEVSALMLLLGLLFLLTRRTISARIPLAFLATVALLTALFPKGDDPLLWMTYHLLSGTLILGACFMATDYTTSPITPGGQWIYGFCCGLLTVFLRYYGSCYDGVPYAILIMNACVWGIDRLTHPLRFGTQPFSGKGALK